MCCGPHRLDQEKLGMWVVVWAMTRWYVDVAEWPAKCSSEQKNHFETMSGHRVTVDSSHSKPVSPLTQCSHTHTHTYTHTHTRTCTHTRTHTHTHTHTDLRQKRRKTRGAHTLTPIHTLTRTRICKSLLQAQTQTCT